MPPNQSDRRLILCLGKNVPWYGRASGYYEMLPASLAGAGRRVRLVRPRRGLPARLAGKLAALLTKRASRDQTLTLAEAEFALLRKLMRPRVSLVLSVEDHLPFAAGRRGRLPPDVVGVVHYPLEIWKESEAAFLVRFHSLLALSTSDIPALEQIAGEGRVRFVPHGVDTGFFRPTEKNRAARRASESARILFVGQFGRDFETLVAAIGRLSARVPGLSFDIVTGFFGKKAPAWSGLPGGAHVRFHTDISDEELLRLYQDSDVMLQPMLFCGANNAVVEGLACGVPIIAADVGGIRDYGGGRIFPLVPPKDPESLALTALRLLENRSMRAEISGASRQFAEENLSWPVAAQKHLAALEELAPAPPPLFRGKTTPGAQFLPRRP